MPMCIRDDSGPVLSIVCAVGSGLQGGTQCTHLMWLILSFVVSYISNVQRVRTQ